LLITEQFFYLITIIIQTMKRNLIILAAFTLASTMFAQAQVGIGTILPAPSSLLEVQSTTKGVLIPRMTGVQRTAIAAPAEGLMVYQLNAPIGLWMFINGAWVRLTTANDLYGTATGFASNTTGSVIAVILGGTSVPLPSNQSLGSNVTINGANTEFTVLQTGRYRIAYGVNMTASLLVSSRLMLNGAPSAAGTVAPALAVSRLSAEVVLNLTAGDTIGLQLFGLLGAVILTPASQGAFMTIQRVE
jgi:hypothetical protein